MTACATYDQAYRTSVPTFAYLCEFCGTRFDHQAHYDEPALVESPCGGPCRRLIADVQWSPQATPNHRNSVPPRPTPPVWERGELADNRGVPLLDENLDPIGVKHYGENRGAITDRLRRLRNDPSVLQPI